jgi:DNA-binding response OmpR family regulator
VLSNHSADFESGPTSAVLLVSGRAEDHDSLQDIFRGSRWKLQGAWTASEGLKEIRRKYLEIAVVICEHSLPDGDWKLMLAELDKAAVRPSLIVSSRVADEGLWAELLSLGAFDLLLGAPFDAGEVLRVTESARLARGRAAGPSAPRRIGPGNARSLAESGASALAECGHL